MAAVLVLGVLTMTKLRSAAHWLTGEWPVPRWICLLIIAGWIARYAGI